MLLMQAAVDVIPEFAGTVPQWGLFGMVTLAFIKLVMPIKSHEAATMQNLCNALQAQVDALQERLRLCEENCTKETEALEEKLHGMRRQHIQEQITLISTIIRSSGSAEMTAMTRLLEQIQTSLRMAHMDDVLHSQDANVIQVKD